VHRHFRLSSSIAIASFVFVSGALAGCGSAEAEDQSIAGPPPSESTVFEASADTKKELGIEKWGFDTDEAGDKMTYRGYAANNAVLAVVEQKLDASDPMHLYFTLSVSGKVGSAVEKIEWYAKPNAEDATKNDVYTHVTENTFEEGSKPVRVLFRFQEDGKAREGGSAGGSLVTQAHPLDEQLVDRCKELNERCSIALIDQRIAAAGQSSECSLLKLAGVPLITGATGAGAGAAIGLLGGPFAAVSSPVGAAVGGITGAVGGVSAQAALCFAARRDARQAQTELNQCRQQQSQAGCR
jgi:hypothetical protein